MTKREIKAALPEVPAESGTKREDVGYKKPPVEHQFKPGNPGGGRPRKTLITDVLEEMLTEKLADPEARQAFKEAHWKKLLSNTVVSSMTLEKVLDRTEGKVSQPVQVSGELTVSLSAEIKKARQRAEEGKS